MKALILALVFWAGQGFAADFSLPVTEYVFDAALAADMITTADIHNHYGMYETNPVMGRHPSDAKIAVYGAASAVVHAGVTLLMQHENVNPKIIQVWEFFSIGFEIGYVAHNYHLGLRMKL